MNVEQRIVALLRDILMLPPSFSLQPATALLGSVPALDSVAVVAILTELEESFGFVIADDELSAEVFATVGTLVAWVERQCARQA